MTPRTTIDATAGGSEPAGDRNVNQGRLFGHEPHSAARVIQFAPHFEGWRQAARRALAEGVAADEVHFAPRSENNPALYVCREHDASLFEEGSIDAAAEVEDPSPVVVLPSFKVPPDFLDQARLVSFHRDRGKWALLYRVLWRLVHENTRLLEISTDADVRAFASMHRAVRIDDHALQAFVRFEPVCLNEVETYVAWHSPAHPILRLGAPFFVRRFPNMPWALLTEDESAFWNTKELTFGPGCPRPPPNSDALTDLWRTYYASVFNPARLNADLYRRKIPRRHRDLLPELTHAEALIAEAPTRALEMRAHLAASARALVPSEGSLEDARAAASRCTGCPLFRGATQTVFGRGPENARIALVGEQPGDEEDVRGAPFVGPAGRVLNDALLAAGLSRESLYLTNAVKHFKWKPASDSSGAGEASGKKRLHVRPGNDEIQACRPWLEREFALVRPQIIVALGATASQSLLGRVVGVERERGTMMRSRFCERTLITYHPSAILRAGNDEIRSKMFASLVNDLALASALA